MKIIFLVWIGKVWWIVCISSFVIQAYETVQDIFPKTDMGIFFKGLGFDYLFTFNDFNMGMNIMVCTDFFFAVFFLYLFFVGQGVGRGAHVFCLF